MRSCQWYVFVILTQIQGLLSFYFMFFSYVICAVAQVHVSVPLVSPANTARMSAQMAVLVKTARNSVSARTMRLAAPRLDSVFALLAGRALVAIDRVKKGDTARTVLYNAIVTTMVRVMHKRDIVHAELVGSAKSVTPNVTRTISGITAHKPVNATQVIRSIVMQLAGSVNAR